MRQRVLLLASLGIFAAFFPAAVLAGETKIDLPIVSQDEDHDGLSLQTEILLGTNPQMADSDGDGLTDGEEFLYYGTNPLLLDSDQDGFNDGDEIKNGFSPLAAGKKLKDQDTDGDGLTDDLEIAFKTNPLIKDTDGDGYEDGREVESGYDPRDAKPTKLEKMITIHTVSQKLRFYLGGVSIGEYLVSTGQKKLPTPTGTFTIAKKSERVWSRLARLWMPWWMNLTGARAPAGLYAIHELPEWPNGVKEGESHLGRPVSHGCVRLGIGPAKRLYDWTPVGTKVVISKD